MSRPITRYLTLRWLAIMMAAVEVGIHAVLVPVHLKETPYIGVLFIVASVLLTAVLISLLIGRVRPVGWLVGAAMCAGMFVAFLLSRTTGLPGYHEPWTSDGGLGIATLPPELVFLACAVHALRLRRAPAAAPYPVEIQDAETLAAEQDATKQCSGDRRWKGSAGNRADA